jgi:hypothetical protein
VSPVAVIVSAAIILLPGTGATLAVYPPGQVGVVTRVALCFVLGCAVSGGVAFILAIAHVLHPLSFFSSLAIVTVGLWVLATRRGTPREHGRAMWAQCREDRWALAAGLLVVIGFAVVRATFSPLLHMQNPTAWRYWADAVEVADAGRIPSHVLQYGMVFPSVVNKVYLNTLNAGISYAIGKEPIPALGALQWLLSVGLALSLWAFGREMGLRFTAAALPVILLANGFVLNRELTTDLTTYKAESFCRVIAFLGAALGIRALRERRGWKDAILAGVLLGVAAGMHIVPVIICVALVAAYAVAGLMAQRDLAGTLRVVLAAGGVTLAVGAGILILPHGDLGLRGAASPGGYDMFNEGFDPTLYLNQGVIPGQGVVGRGALSLSPGKTVEGYVHSALGLKGTPRMFHEVWVPGLVVGGIIAAIVIFLWFPRDLRPVGVTALGLGAAIVALTWLFALRYHLYIPARFGVRRLFDYSSIPVVLLALALAEGALFALGRVRSWMTPVFGFALVVLVAAALLPAGRAHSPEARALALVQGFDWIREHTPCDTRLLPDGHPEGVFEAVTGRVAVLEGATPFLRPNIIQPIVRLLLNARDFFHDPQGHRGFLRTGRVDFVVVLTAGHVAYREAIGAINQTALAGLSSLQRVFANVGMTIYRVTGVPSATGQPEPSAFPGYDCFRSPIATG